MAVTLACAGAASAQPGSLDATFNGTGVVSLPSGSQLFGVAVQSNGEIVAAGQSAGSVLVRRYTTAGASDGQYIGHSGVARAVAIQSDGKIVIAGTSGGAMFVERLTSNLAPDSSFGAGGLVTAFGGQGGVANAVAIAPDGSIVAAGTVGGPNTRVGVARFAPSGSLDWSVVPGFDQYSVVSGIAIQPSDGKIVFVGRQTPSQSTDALIGRLTPGGALDSTFAGGGVFTYHYPGGGYTSLNAVTVQNDGRIVAAGIDVGGPNAIFLRVNPNGSLDSSFGSGGVAALPSAENLTTNPGAPIGAYGVGIAGGGRIVGAGNFENTATDVDAAAWAFKAGGAPETTFGNGGTVTNPTGGYEACALAIAPDGSLVSVGSTVTSIPDNNPCTVNGSAAGFVARYIGYGPPPPPLTTTVPPVSTGSAPSVVTGVASSIGEVSATIAGKVDPDGLPTSYHFEYGKTKAYGSSTSAKTLPAEGSSVTVSARVSLLRPGTTYHYRLVASNADGTSYGADRTFTTAPRLALRLSGLLRSYLIATVEKHGLGVGVRCSHACSIRGSLVIGAASAKRLGLGTRRLTIGSGTASLKRAGTAHLVLHLSSKAKGAITGLRQLSVSLRISATPSGGGPAAVESKTIAFTG